MKLKWMTETSIKWNEKTVKAIILIPNVLYKEKKIIIFFGMNSFTLEYQAQTFTTI